MPMSTWQRRSLCVCAIVHAVIVIWMSTDNMTVCVCVCVRAGVCKVYDLPRKSEISLASGIDMVLCL